MITASPLQRPRSSELLAFSAASWAEVGERLANAQASAKSLSALAFELAARPAAACRLAIVAEGEDDFARKAAKAAKMLGEGREQLNLAFRVFAARAPEMPPRVAFLFPGFAAQYPNMVGPLHARFAVVREFFAAAGEADRRRYAENALIFSALAEGPGEKARLLRESTLRQISNASLVANLSWHHVLGHLGVGCDAMAGHSFGENAALVAAGMVQDHHEVAALLRLLTKALHRPAEATALLAVAGAAFAAVAPGGMHGVHVALDNCPQQTILCGEVAAIAEIEARLKERREPSFRLPRLERPVHTPGFPVPVAELRALYGRLELSSPRRPLYSCSTAAPFPDGSEAVRAVLADQWVTTVRFRDTVRRLYDDGIRTFLEVGPAGNLAGFVRDTLRGEPIAAFSVDREGVDPLLQLQVAVAQLWIQGQPCDLARLWDEPPADVATLDVATIAARAASRAAISQPRQDLLERVLAAVAGVLGLSDVELIDAELIDAELGFFELGMGSLAAVELSRRLERELGLPLAPTAAFDYPTASRLAAHLGALAGGAAASPSPASTARPAAVRPVDGEPLAIVGVACRFPGGADTPEAFWRLLRAGGDAIVDLPAGRWPGFAAGERHARVLRGGFLETVDTFDAAFFGISPREAQTLDPQQRLLLEVAWEALERAGLPPKSLDGAAAGVFVGISTDDYLQRLMPEERLAAGGYLATGNARSTAAGRLSHVLGAQGPCLALDTACSSSLVAIHLACQSLRRGECDVALAGGVGLLLAPETSLFLTDAEALSPQGRCATFGAGADGYVRAEGCGMVALKRLRDAVAAGDPVLALIRGSAINHDGHTSGLTVPNGLAQQAVIERALADAGVDRAEVGYVEAHGTGTALGDPIEVAALGRIFAGRDPGLPVRLGSVKTNVGHLEAAAGVAGLLKVVLQLQHGELAPSLHADPPNPHIDWDALPLRVARQLEPWPPGPRPRVAGLSSFGISGTNAHVILQEAPSPFSPPTALGWHLLPLSAKTPAALDAAAARLAERLAAPDAPALADVARTLQTGRDAHRYRRAVVADSAADAVAALSRREEAVTAGKRRRLAFLFTGQGAQLPGMGLELFGREPVFRRALEACDAWLRPHREIGLIDLLRLPASGDHPLDRTAYAQPALFALGYALAELWRSWGIEPDAVIGHSVGEITAACVAGVLTPEDALRLVAERGARMQSLPAGGGMAAVAGSEERIAALLGGEVELAAVNGPRDVVLAGPLPALEAVVARLRAEGVRCGLLRVSHAFHSAQMDSILEDFGAFAARLQHHPPRVALISNLDGAPLATLHPASHWRRHLRQPVHFAAGLRALRAAGCTAFLELGPKPVLTALGQEAEGRAGDLWLPSLHPPQPEERRMLESLGELHRHGAAIDWAAVAEPRGGRRIVLPTYAFQRERHWLEPASASSAPAASKAPRRAAPAAGADPFLGHRLDLPGAEPAPRFEAALNRAELGFLADHRVFGQQVLPPSAFLAAALRLGALADPATAWRIEHFVVQQPAIVGDDPFLLHSALEPHGDAYRCRFFSREGEQGWRLHAEAGLRPVPLPPPAFGQGAPTLGADAAVLEREAFYASCREAGFDFGPSFQVLERIEVAGAAALGVAAIPSGDELAGRRSTLALEGALQTLAVLVGSQERSAGYLLHEIGGLELHSLPAALIVLAQLEAAPAGDEARAALRLLDAATLAEVGALEGIRYLPAPAAEEAPEVTWRGVLLAALAAGEGEAAILRYVRELAHKILRVPLDRPFDAGQPLPELGFDSMMAVWFRNRLESDLDLRIEPAEFLREPTLANLAATIRRQLAAGGAPAAAEQVWVEGEL